MFSAWPDLGRVAGGARRDRAGARVGHRLEGAALVSHVALHRVDQVRDQVVAPLQLDVDLRPGFLGPVPGRDQPVVGEDEPKDDEDDDRERRSRCPSGSALSYAATGCWLRVGAPRPTGLLKHLLVLVLAHLLAPLLDYRAQSNSQTRVIFKRGSRPRRPGIIPEAGLGLVPEPTLHADVLHRRPRGAPAAHPQVPREGGQAPPRGVGGEDLPDSIFKRFGELGFLGLRYPPEYGGQGGDYFSAIVLSEEMARAGCGGLGHGGRGPDRDGHAAGLQVRHRGAEAPMAGAGDPRRADRGDRDHRARRRLGRGRHHDHRPPRRRPLRRQRPQDLHHQRRALPLGAGRHQDRPRARPQGLQPAAWSRRARPGFEVTRTLEKLGHALLRHG